MIFCLIDCYANLVIITTQIDCIGLSTLTVATIIKHQIFILSLKRSSLMVYFSDQHYFKEKSGSA